MQRFERDVQVTADGGRLPGRLVMPANVSGVVVFAHGSGSSRHSPRNVEVASALNERGCATLLFDLLTEDEAFDRRNVFDIPLLGRRMADAVGWISRRDEFLSLPIGLFGASTGAAAALVAAAAVPHDVSCVVSRGGRPDLADDALERVAAPTLLLVGELDTEVIELNRTAMQRMTAETHLQIIENATHLFEEPGALEQVSMLAGNWFVEKFAAASSAAGGR